MSVTWQQAQAAIYDAFIAAFDPATLDEDTQIVLGPEPFDPAAETTWARLEVVETESRLHVQGSTDSRDWRRDGVALCAFSVTADASDAAMNTLVQLFRDTFEGADIDDVIFGSGVTAGGTGQDGRWATRVCRAPFHFYEQR